MEEQQHNNGFEEQYWDDALQVLKREERKQTLRKVLPLALLLLLVSTGVFILLPQGESALKASTVKVDPIRKELSIQNTNDNATTSLTSQTSFTNDAKTEVEATSNTASDSQAPKSEGQKVDQRIPAVSADQVASTEGKAKEKDELQATKEVEEQQEKVEVDTNSESQANESSPTDNSGFDRPELKENSTDYKASILFQEATNKASTAGNGDALMVGMDPREARFASHQGSLRFTSYEDKHARFLRNPTKPQQLLVYVGNTFLNGYGSSKGSTPFNPQLGIAYEQRVANKLWLRGQAGMQRISEVNQVREYLEEQSTFGYRAIQTLISSDQLYLADVSAAMVWDMNLRHSLFVGAGAEMLALTVNTVTKNEINAFETQQLEERSDYGYLTGYDTFFANVNAGYRYRLSRLSSLDMFIQTGGQTIADKGRRGNTRIGVRWNVLVN